MATRVLVAYGTKHVSTGEIAPVPVVGSLMADVGVRARVIVAELRMGSAAA